MSYSTQADQAIEAARDHIEGAVTSLGSVVINRIGGTEDYRSTYLSQLKDALDKVYEARELLDPLN